MPTTFLWEGEAPAEPCSAGIFVGQSLALPVRLLRCPIADLNLGIAGNHYWPINELSFGCPAGFTLCGCAF